jgi:hypothetical protein
MMVACKKCSTLYDDADRTTICPHGLIMPPTDLVQKKLALELCDHDICFAHQPDGPTHRIQSINWNGMVTLHDMVGQFAPHLFVKAMK